MSLHAMFMNLTVSINPLASFFTSLAARNSTISPTMAHSHSHPHSATPVDEEAFWEKMAPRYDSMPVAQAGAKISSNAILQAIKGAGISEETTKTWDVLEVGGGGGGILPYLLPSFSTIHITDTSPAMLKQVGLKLVASPAYASQVTYSIFSVGTNAYEDFALPSVSPTVEEPERKVEKRAEGRRQFDLVFGTMMLHHVEDLEGFLKGVEGLLKEGGMVVFTDMAKEGREEGQEKLKHAHSHSHAHAHSHDHNHHYQAPQDSDDISPLMKESAVSRPANQHKPGFEIAQLTAQLLAAGFVEPNLAQKGRIPMPKDLETGECGDEYPLLVIVARKKSV